MSFPEDIALNYLLLYKYNIDEVIHKINSDPTEFE